MTQKSCLVEAYERIFSQPPNNSMMSWQIAQALIESFDVRLMGESLARQVILEIVNHVAFPNAEITQQIIGRAEGFASELFPEFSHTDEIHMAQLERLERTGSLQ